MLARIDTGALHGIDALPVSVEVQMTLGLPGFDLVGLGDAAVKEARTRVHAAIKNSGYELPQKRITVNLAPADLRKEGGAFDLPIALGVLAAAGLVPLESLLGVCVAGELSLTGEVRRIRGALSLAVAARDQGLCSLLLPSGNAREAAAVDGLDVIPVRSLSEIVEHLRGNSPIMAAPRELPGEAEQALPGLDWRDVRGQWATKRALKIAAAGGHNVLMVGAPGSGKTMLARRLPTILPRLTLDEALETTRVYSVSGLLPEGHALVAERPFRAPHHTVSYAGLAGGGTHPRPGELSLAHNGVLFLDEMAEFQRHVLEVLRQPLEERRVTISRAARSLSFPASFTLVAATNPCPCGWYGHPDRPCTCAPHEIQRYRSRLSGPLMDRVDIHALVAPVAYEDLSRDEGGESSAEVRAEVEAARALQRERLRAWPGVRCNAEMGARLVRTLCRPDREGARLLCSAMKSRGLTARAHDRILKVARTIADLESAAEIGGGHVMEAIGLRALESDGSTLLQLVGNGATAESENACSTTAPSSA